MSIQHIKEILSIYEQKRRKAEKLQEKNIQNVYERFPRIETIDNEIRKLGLIMTKSLLKSSSNAQAIFENYKQRTDQLSLEKISILKENSISIHFSKISYSCEYCKDTGFVNTGKKCSCLKQQLINKAYSLSNLSTVLEKENFNTFDLSLFADVAHGAQHCSPRQNILEILSICEHFVMNFSKVSQESLLFFGPTGVGKTFLINCIAKALLDKGKIVLYLTAIKMFEILEGIRFHATKDKKIYDLLFDSDLLIIDDLGTELTNAFTNSELFNIINTRILINKKTVISTNLTPEDIKDRYDDRIFSRLLSSKYCCLKFYGDDLRAM
ncbi:MAG: ATP-binding protein [Clostridiales bacterium]|nr:ATP-binding protein [Clostridiales bacterium]